MTGQNQIGFIIESLRIGGAERVVANLATEFDENGWDVDIVVTKETGYVQTEVPESINIQILESDRALASMPKLIHYFQRRRPDVFVSNMTHINLVATVSAALSRVDTELILIEHSMLSERIDRTDSRKERLTAMLAGRIYLLADEVVTVSDGLADDVATTAGIDPSLITTIYNPVDIEEIRRQGKKRVDHKWFKSSNLSVIIGVGRLEVRKDFSSLLKSFARVANNRRCRLVICGDGPRRGHLENLVNRLGIEDCVHFLGWVENPYKYMSKADVFVLSSVTEGFANVIVEALAVGCPVVSTNCESGPAEILGEGTWGELVSVGDEEELSSAIKETLNQPPHVEYLHKRANSFDKRIIYDQYVKLLGFED